MRGQLKLVISMVKSAYIKKSVISVNYLDEKNLAHYSELVEKSPGPSKDTAG